MGIGRARTDVSRVSPQRERRRKASHVPKASMRGRFRPAVARTSTIRGRAAAGALGSAAAGSRGAPAAFAPAGEARARRVGSTNAARRPYARGTESTRWEHYAPVVTVRAFFWRALRAVLPTTGASSTLSMPRTSASGMESKKVDSPMRAK